MWNQQTLSAAWSAHPRTNLINWTKLVGTVYQYNCQECPSLYIGETERPLKKRVAEHKREPSPVGAHSKDAKHKFNPEQFKILDSDPRWFQRGIKEAVYIAAAKPDLNRDFGCHPLPKAYKKLIESHDLGSTSGRSRDHVTRSAPNVNTTSSHQCWRRVARMSPENYTWVIFYLSLCDLSKFLPKKI